MATGARSGNNTFFSFPLRIAVIVDKKSESFIREGLPPSAALFQPITINTMNPLNEQELLQVPEELRELFRILDEQAGTTSHRKGNRADVS